MSAERNTVLIRPANNDDLAAIVDFNIRLASESEDKSLDRSILTEGVRAVLNDESKARYFVAEVDTNPAGMLMITYEWSDWRNGQVWWLQNDWGII